MILIGNIAQIRRKLKPVRIKGKTIGLVPTMGALHQGHLSLIKTCRDNCEYCVVSIFVNPTQFGPREDLDSYPKTMAADCQACQELGVDLIFAPQVQEMYPQPGLSWVNVEKLTERLCGASRPNHFRGVATVVSKLFNIIQPDIAWFGQKDAQQLAVIRRMTEDLNFPVEIRACPIVRLPDGLALSSRNQYLSQSQRQQAVCLYRALSRAQEMFQRGVRDSQEIVAEARGVIQRYDQARIDYIEIVDAQNLQPIKTLDRPALLAMAVFLGTTRLIDNVVLRT